MFAIPLDRLGDLFAGIAQGSTLYVPMDRGGQADFGIWTPESSASLNYLNTARSVKDFFLPQTENIAGFKCEGNNISITPNREAPLPFVVFGARGCDVRALDALDKVFLSDPADAFYKARRENGTIISLVCAEPEETCFCGAFGIDAADPPGDVVTGIAGELLFWEAKTPAGEALTDKVKGILAEAGPDGEVCAEKCREAARIAMKELPLAELSLKGFDDPDLMETFNSRLWGKLSQSCIGCGTCTYVCPTCHCYDIRDFDTGHEIKRFRCWDSCMYSDFTLMAHGNPRKSQLERFRQRFMHKLVYFPDNNDGIYACVGCGRCLSKCPVSMNIVRVIKESGGKADV